MICSLFVFRGPNLATLTMRWSMGVPWSRLEDYGVGPQTFSTIDPQTAQIIRIYTRSKHSGTVEKQQ